MALLATAQLASAATSSAAVVEVGPTEGGVGLSDGRVYEQVSPPAKHGYQAGAGVNAEDAYGIASPDGDRVLYWDSGPIGEAGSGVDKFSVSSRTATGWHTRAALPAPAPEPRDPILSLDPVWLEPSEDLSSVTFTAHSPFAPASLDFTNPEFSFVSTYLSSEGGPATWLGAPTAEDPVPALEEVQEASDLVLVGASADMSVVYYEYYGTLLAKEDDARKPIVAEGNSNAWGIYEWRDGRLKAAGLLPSGQEDEYGAVAASVGVETLGALPFDFDNQVSSNGNTMLFVSPSPEAGSGRPSQLYARIDGTTTILLSRSSLTGLPSASGVDAVNNLSQSHVRSYAYGSPDGSHAFFASEDQLTSDAPSDGTLKEYEFDLQTESLSYLPTVTAPILVSSEDGSTLAFDDTRAGHNELAVFSDGHTTDVVPLPPPGEGNGPLYVAPVRLDSAAKSLVFQTNSPIAGFNNRAGLAEIYRYDIASEGLSCISCPGVGHASTGSASLSNDDSPNATQLVTDSRGISEDGSEIFFDTPDSLVPTDTNEARDVYEWHAGHLSLISAGSGSGESVFLDNSASGGDVFFATTEDLSGTDTDGSFDVYDARVGGGIASAGGEASSGCANGCPPAVSQPQPLSLASTSLFGRGEQVVSPIRHGGPRPLTRAQKLARSLRACRRKHGHARHACEGRARKRYGKRRVRGRA